MIADLLETAAPRLMASVEAAVSASTKEVIARRTIERLRESMRGLIAQLRAAQPDETAQLTGQRVQFDVAAFVAAVRLLRNAVYALIDDGQLAVTPREMRTIVEWFATVAMSALLAENHRFADMLDAIPDHLLLYNADGLRIIYVNRATADGAKEISTRFRDEFMGRRVVDIVDDKRFGEYVEACLRRVATGESLTEEFIFPSADGGRWHEQLMSPVRGPGGKVDAITITSRDIHAHKKAEARLQLLSKLGALSEANAQDGLIDALAHLSIPELADWCLINVVDHRRFQRTTLAHRDPAQAALAEELLRLPSELHALRVGQAALAGHATLLVAIDRANAPHELVQTEIVKRLQVRSAMVVPLVVMDIPVAIATFMMTPESGRRYGAEDFALAQEMARRAGQMIENAQLQQQLAQSEARFRLALEHANISVFEADRQRRIRWSYNSQLGASDAALLGKTMSEVLGDDGVELDRLKRKVIDSGEGAGLALTTLRDGRRRHLMIRCQPLRGVGTILGITGATIDVTELKDAEEQLARELGFRERMMGVLGHDLRNPVSAVLATAGLLRLDAAPTDRVHEGLALIEQSARRMNEMIATLLDFTRLRFHGSLPIAAREIDLHAALRGVIAELQAAHRGRDITLAVDGDVRGHWDPSRMAQLLSNLASNALAHGARAAAVDIALRGEPDRVHLSVSNRGPTIAPALVERLFEPFQQGAESSEGRTRGLGLGLFIVREIARAHGGTIDVRSSDDVTTFVVHLPRHHVS